MRLLLDECVDQRLRHLFVGYDCQSAAYAALAGLKNGALLAAAVTSEYQRPDSGSCVSVPFLSTRTTVQNRSLRRFHILCKERQHCTKRLRHLWVLQTARLSFWRKAVREHIEQVIKAHHTVEPVFNSLTR